MCSSTSSPSPPKQEDGEIRPSIIPIASSPNDDDNKSHNNNNNKLALALFACFQNALVGGIIFGWASIEKTMLQAPHNKGGAALTAIQTTQLFTYGSTTSMLSSLLLGPLLDTCGPKFCLLTSHAFVLLGCAGFAMSTKFIHFVLAVISIAFGGPGIGIGIIHVSNLFPQNQFLAVSCLAGSITISFSMLAILESIWEYYDGNIGFRILFGSYSFIVAISMILTLFLSPNEPYEMENDDDDEDSDNEEEQDEEFKEKDGGGPSLEQEYVEATIHTYAHHHQHPFLLTDQSLNSTLRREPTTCNDDDDDDDYDDGTDYHHENEGGFHQQITSDHSSSSRNYHHHHHHHMMHLEKHQSFYQSKKAIESGNETAVKLMSLKDQPFVVQFKSPTFARAVLIFVSTSFIANLTIASLTTELQDLGEANSNSNHYQFNEVEQHDLSQQFTWLLSLGMVYAVLVGWLMDRLGLEACTLLTLILGQLSSLFMLMGGSLPYYHDNDDNDHHGGGHAYLCMVISFALYSLFRQFLFPVFLAFITNRLGFKYFGILSGIGFAISGLVQCFMAQLVELVHEYDDIHNNSNNDGEGGGDGKGWMYFHVVEIVVMALLMVIPIADHRDIQQRQVQMEKALTTTTAITTRSPARSTTSTSTTVSSIAAKGDATPLLLQKHARTEIEENDIEYGSLENGEV